MRALTLHNLSGGYAVEDNRITLQALAKTDLVVDSQTGETVANAAFLAAPITGDFTVRAKVSHAFLSLYDACCLIAYENDSLWAKACFECSAPDTHTVVSVMTNGRSDDANGPDVAPEAIWLQMARKGNALAVHYSLDGQTYHFVRILHLPFSETLQVGFLGQSPLGDGGEFRFEDCALLAGAPADLRAGC